MEEIAVVKPVGGRRGCDCLPSCGCGCANGCSDKSRAARRRRMEIRRFKVIAANAAAESSGPSYKKVKCSTTAFHTGCCCRTADEDEGKDSEKASEIVSSSTPLVSVSVGGDADQCPQHGVVSICGGRREMEDAVRIVPSLVAGADGFYHFFGVFDGHGGSQVALHCKERLAEVLAEEIRSIDSVKEAEWEAVMKSSFLKVDVEVAGLCGNATQLRRRGIESHGEKIIIGPVEAKAPETVGSTAVVAVVSSRQIIVANCGDSRAVLSTGGKAIPLSFDHKPEVAEEMARIEAAGGRVIYWNGYRVLGVLAMSRAIGDEYLKPYVIAEPELSFRERNGEDECLILASDGLWDVVSNEVACEISRKCLAYHCSTRTMKVDGACPRADSVFESPAATAAALLTKLAVARGSADNISVIVVDLRK